MRISVITFILCWIFIGNIHAQSPPQQFHINPYFHKPLKHGAHRIGTRQDADMQRWCEYGLGQFIHWGVYSIPGGVWNEQKYTGAAEWIRVWNGISNEEYDNLYKQFNPTNFDAKKWARQAKEMGAKYLIFTTKHHDGFCMWKSATTDYHIGNTPYGKDIVKEIVDAYTAEGISVYLYFSIIDWSHPGYISGGNINSPDVKQAFQSDAGINPFISAEQEAKYEDFKEFTHAQLLELLENYPQIKGLWFDGSWDVAWVRNAAWVDALGHELREKHPGLIIGSRFRSDELGNRHEDANGHLIDDYDQRYERNLPASFEETKGFDWDCVMTIPENQWGYHRDWSWTYVKTPYELIEMTVRANSMNGNFVINFGPDGMGNIREEETEIAREIGKWMAKNGEAIYGTRRSILEDQNWGHSTQKDDYIYLTIFNKPLNNMVRVKLPRSTDRDKVFMITESSILSTSEPVILNGGGRPGTFYRDKFGNSYFDLVVPESQRNSTMPFVMKIKVKEIDRGDMELYQQALI
ncbi:MAG: alpha-L-fucosidase [Dysgonamonadaceae bacterium]|nr:alpha-L-fucosidase [Dysgonamonadaceae bacterium]